MPIWKIDGIGYLDSGTAIVAGDAVIEIEFQLGRDSANAHEVALKFRSDDGPVEIRVGNPPPVRPESRSRTVVIFANFPLDTVSTNGGVSIGEIDGKGLWLAFLVEPYPTSPPGNVRHLSYMLYTGSKRR